jgi:plasmid replication initiation protein
MIMAKSNSVEVRQSNAITTARYDYSACQLDIIFYLLFKLKKSESGIPELEYTIHVRDIEKITKRSWNYQQLREATEDLGRKMFEVEDAHSYKQIWTFQKVEYIKGKGCLEIWLSQAIIPYLFDLKNNFTSYQLQSALKVSSKYAKRIYQLCSQWKDVGMTKTYELSDFKEMLGLKDPHGKTPEQFERISAFKSKVLDIAKLQINQNTDLSIDYELIKQGKTYNHIRFFVTKQDLKQIPLDFGGDERKERAKQMLNKLGIADEKIVAEIVNNHLDKFFKWHYDYQTNKIKVKTNPAGLLLKTLGIL